VQDVPRLPQPTRTLVVPLLAAALGAGLATATFALVNIEDQATVSLPSVQSAQPSEALPTERVDGGPEEGAAQQAMSPVIDLRGSTAAATTGAPTRYDGGPNEGASADAIADTQPPKPAGGPQPRYDGGPDEGSSASAIAQP